MVSYNWDFSVVFAHKQAILTGALVTLELAMLSIFFGSLIGLGLALLKSSRNKAIKFTAASIIEVFRDLPLLVLMVWLFYTLPPITGIQVSAFATAVLALSLNLGAFSAEIFRAGFNSVPKGQIEAAKVLGLKNIHSFRHIIFPQALKVILPPLTGRYIETIKLTSLASIIAVNELLHQGQNLISVSYRPLEVYTAVALMYLAIIVPLSLLLQKVERQHVRS